jgi:hypothetical protein
MAKRQKKPHEIRPSLTTFPTRDAPRLVAVGRRAPPRLVLEVDVGERLRIAVADDETLPVRAA